VAETACWDRNQYLIWKTEGKRNQIAKMCTPAEFFKIVLAVDSATLCIPTINCAK
jgi:hypothetical protein